MRCVCEPILQPVKHMWIIPAIIIVDNSYSTLCSQRVSEITLIVITFIISSISQPEVMSWLHGRQWWDILRAPLYTSRWSTISSLTPFPVCRELWIVDSHRRHHHLTHSNRWSKHLWETLYPQRSEFLNHFLSKVFHDSLQKFRPLSGGPSSRCHICMASEEVWIMLPSSYIKIPEEQTFLRNPRKKINAPQRERGGKSIEKGNEWYVM